MSPTEDAVPVVEDAVPAPTQVAVADVTPAVPTDVTADNQTPPENPDEPVDDGVTDPDAAFDAALKAALEVERERIRKEAEEAAEARRRAADAERAAEAEAERFRNSWATATKEAHEAFKALPFRDENGRPVTVPDDVFQRTVVEHFQKHNATVQQGVTSSILNQLGEIATSLIPEAERESFASKATGKPLDEWLRMVADTLAPHSTYAREKQLEIEQKVKAAEARALARAQRSPQGTPRPVGDRPENTNQPDMNTQLGLAKALALGIIDEAQYREKRAGLG